MAVYGVLVSDPAIWWDTPAAAVVMKAMDGKGCKIMFVACAHTLTGERGVFVRHAGEEDFFPHQRSNAGLVCVTINVSELLL